MEVCKMLKWKVANDVRVENEERGVIFSKDLLGKLQGSGCAKGFGLDGKFDLDIVLLLVLR